MQLVHMFRISYLQGIVRVLLHMFKVPHLLEKGERIPYKDRQIIKIPRSEGEIVEEFLDNISK